MRHRSILVISMLMIVFLVGAAIHRSGAVAVRSTNTRSIIGSKQPELIPDNIAYLMFFRLIANRQSDKEKMSIQSYLKQAGITEKSDIEALLVLAESFHQKVSVIDQQTSAIKRRYYPNRPNLTDQEKELLNQLVKQREIIVTEIVTSLPSRLSSSALARLRTHINERVKRNMKLYGY